ncbi:MAG: GDP-mannose 4,6-dehydratase [Actinomycetota bacterium]|nr:GDP-mannose 4,6-dehydratase [Actinomycetota bacterium]
MRALVTGGTGFVGRWLLAHLEQVGDEAVVAAPDVDVTDAAGVAEAVRAARPEAVYHLAGLAHVGGSWERPQEYFRVNAGGTLNVLQAAAGVDPPPTVLLVSSAEVYGAVTPDRLPLGEDAPLRPVSPYAAGKAAAELLGVQAHLGQGVPVVRARPFNHAGPGQAPTFVVPALARRIVAAQRDGTRALPVGNLSPRRDLLDVRDVVRAYRLLVVSGQAGEVYNVCSGRDVAVEELVGRLLALAGADLDVVADPALVRPVDVPVLRGDPSRLRQATGWAPAVSLDDTLAAVLDEARAEVAGRVSASRPGPAS